ncbi:MAG TPA: hypothetical protein VHZ03_30690 [Trebonia sp.]|jgi:hypothetical protein|nr:hypothetical protein [Trebonia sp.]
MHIAVDRFTVSVLEGSLYSSGGSRGTFTIEADLLPGAASQSQPAEIMAVPGLEDLNDGIIGMNAAITRSYGSVDVAFDAADTAWLELDAARRTLIRMVRGDDPK